MERRRKQSGEIKRIENEELVKYMSSLPSYLEKGENLKEKAFSVGVLDWRFLEKWQHEHITVPCRSNGNSPSSSNTLSFSSSMEGSSSNSSRARSCSPTRRWIHRPTSQSHYASPPKGNRHFGPHQSHETKSSCSSSKTIEPSAYSGKFRFSPPRGKYKQEKKSTVTLNNPAALKISEVVNQKDEISETTKVRNPSPTRRFSMAMGRLKDMMTVPQGVKWPAEQSGSDKARTSSSVDTACDKSDTTGRSRSSPLRRLLDPLLKPKAGNSDQVTGSSTKRGESPTRRSLKVKLDLKGCKSIDIDDARSNVASVPSKLQALFQVAVKNGLPLFTFAVDNEIDILAATVKKFSSTLKENGCWIYTFFTIRETKKKSGTWLNQVGKDRSHGITPNIVGKMKVSDVPFSESNRQKLDLQFRIREFVLFATDERHQPNDEIAAIVVKLPNRTATCPDGSDRQNNSCNNISALGSTKPFEDLSMTVILPGGAHSLPSKGEPPSLIDRWKSGGSCDCGGWDLGCRMRILVNHTTRQWISSCTKPEQIAERFELLYQGGVPDNKSVFSLSTFKDGIFSVEFSSSLKPLQAFSICIAVLNCRNQEIFQIDKT